MAIRGSGVTVTDLRQISATLIGTDVSTVDGAVLVVAHSDGSTSVLHSAKDLISAAYAVMQAMLNCATEEALQRSSPE